MSNRPIAIIGGAIANKYLNGGAVWTRLNWALGIRNLGFDTYFIEQIAQDDCRDKHGRVTGFTNSCQLDYFRQVLGDFGFSGKCALIYGNGPETFGLSQVELRDLATAAAVMVNITGHLRQPEFMASPACKIYVDLDPGFTQLWYERGLLDSSLTRHDHFFSVGEAIGSPGCRIPAGDIPWKPVRQPVVLDYWPVSAKGDPGRFTTIAAWRDDYGPVEFEGETLGLKVHEFRKFMAFPERVEQSCEMALKIYPEDQADLERLQNHGWVIRDPVSLAPGPSEFRDYVQGSGAEFSVAKGIYTHTRSAWFSDRTVRYLASGKPALVQDTGFSDRYPVGDGLFAFRTMDEAVAGARQIAGNYRQHCRAARQIAETYFDSKRVLGRVLEQSGVVV